MQPLRPVGQQQACRTGESDGPGVGKAQVNTAALRPAQAGAVCRQRAGWRGPGGLGERKSSVRHIQICPRHRWEGWTGQNASASSCPAGRRREASLSFQQGGPGGPERYRDTQIHRWQLRYPGRVAGVGGARTHRGREEGQRGPLRRRGLWRCSRFFQQRDVCRTRRKSSMVVSPLGLCSASGPPAWEPCRPRSEETNCLTRTFQRTLHPSPPL